MAYKTGYNIRAERIQEITRQHYEPGRQDRNYRWVWRYHIQPVFGIGYHSYLKYLKAEIPSPQDEEDPRCTQLTLFEDDR